jgi:hypothetical protein
MVELVINENYKSILSLRETERAIKFIDLFQKKPAEELNLQRVSAAV